MEPETKRFRLKGAAAGVVGIFTILVLIKLLSPGGLTRFAGFGEAFEHRYIDEVATMGAYIKPDSGGYDGQFYAQLATDPTLRNPKFNDAIDEPAYRARRILLPALSHLLAFGNPTISILIYCSLNIFFWYAFAWVVWSQLQVHDWRGFAKWTACVFSMGVMDSVKYSLTDLPSMLLILLMIQYSGSKKYSAAGGFVASVFLKETNLLAAAALPNLNMFPKKWFPSFMRWVLTGVITLALFYGWYHYIKTQFGVFHGVSGNFDFPFTSMVRNTGAALKELSLGNLDDRYIFRLLAVLGFVIQFLFLLTQYRDFRAPLVRLGWVYAFLFMFLGDLVWWGYWAVCRVALPMTIAFNLLYSPKSNKGFWVGLIFANLTVIHALYRFL